MAHVHITRDALYLISNVTDKCVAGPYDVMRTDASNMNTVVIHSTIKQIVYGITAIIYGITVACNVLYPPAVLNAVSVLFVGSLWKNFYFGMHLSHDDCRRGQRFPHYWQFVSLDSPKNKPQCDASVCVSFCFSEDGFEVEFSMILDVEILM